MKQHNHIILYHYINQNNITNIPIHQPNMNTHIVEENQYPYIITRLLYSRIEVNQSLFIALLEHNTDDALYWVYELYYSGFYEETILYLHSIYTLLYAPLSSNRYIGSRFPTSTSILENDDKERLIGSLVLTLSKREYDITQFIRNYMSSSLEYIEKENPITTTTKNTKKPMFLKVSKETVQKYAIIPPRRPLRTEYNFLFLPPPTPNDVLVNTLSYTEGCPYWEEIIEQYQDTPIIIIDERTTSTKSYKEKLRHLVPTFYEDYGDIISVLTATNNANITKNKTIEEFIQTFTSHL